jgi:GTP pyrophosphokinase
MTVSEVYDHFVVDDVDTVLRAFRASHPAADEEPIRRAFEIARACHEGQYRKSGDSYITHPLAVALFLAQYGLDTDTIVAALLHDTVEDTEMTLEQIKRDFGETVALLIDGVTKLDRVKFSNREEQQAATIRKMVLAMAKDVRVLLIKLADRLHNVRTLDALPPEKQQRIAAETIDVYAPLAHRLGVQEIKHEMEDRCFAILHPRRYGEIEELLRIRAPEREAYLTDVVGRVGTMLREHGIAAVVSGRPKHPYSIYRKMVGAGRSFEEIHDLVGIRIITDGVSDCYAALGIIHTRWPPVHGRFKDYIAMPKFNLYQSLHTTVLGPGRKPLEVQIRTEEMHDRAEHGIAAHWRYKEGEEPPPEVESVRAFAYLSEDYEDPSEFLAGLKLDLYQDEVFVLTPKGDVKTLPAGSTPVDFAYSVHTEVGHRCSGARVNGRLVPLDTRLESGDIVDVIVSKSADAGPSRDWLTFVRTSRAAAKIRQWFSRERRQNAIVEGRDQVLRLLRKEGLGLSAAERDEGFAEVASSMGFQDLDGMYQAVGENNVQAATVVQRLVRIRRPEEPETDEEEVLPPVPRRERPPSRGVVVEGLEDMWVRMARCCAPVPGDDIVGFVTVGRGVSVHRADCTNIGSLEERAERMVEVSWGAGQRGSFAVWLQIEALDRPRLLRDVTTTLTDLGLDIAASSSGTGRDRVAIIRFEVELADTTQLERAITELKGVEGVFDAYRLKNV